MQGRGKERERREGKGREGRGREGGPAGRQEGQGTWQLVVAWALELVLALAPLAQELVQALA